MDGQHGKKENQNEEIRRAEMGQASHQLWENGCFYVGLDPPQLLGLIYELFSSIIWLETSKWLVSRKNTSIRRNGIKWLYVNVF